MTLKRRKEKIKNLKKIVKTILKYFNITYPYGSK